MNTLIAFFQEDLRSVFLQQGDYNNGYTDFPDVIFQTKPACRVRRHSLPWAD